MSQTGLRTVSFEMFISRAFYLFRKPTNSKQARPECHINYLLTQLSTPDPYCHDPGPILSVHPSCSVIKRLLLTISAVSVACNKGIQGCTGISERVLVNSLVLHIYIFVLFIWGLTTNENIQAFFKLTRTRSNNSSSPATSDSFVPSS